MGHFYREQVAHLHDALRDPAHRDRAAEIIRGLVERIELRPVAEDGKKTLAVSLTGKIAGILALSQSANGSIDSKTPSCPDERLDGVGDVSGSVTKLVAGVGFEPTTFRL